MRKVCVYTSTRAEYGLLKPLIEKIYNSPGLSLKLLVSGAHLVAEQGMTIEEIRSDGFEPDQCVDIFLGDDSRQGVCRSMGKALTEYGKYFIESRPDILVLLGDRFEAFCCASAAYTCQIPIAHIHGGETTQGAIDEAFRHCITKMAHLHFPCCEEYRHRIIQLGEAPERVHNVGALGVENIKKIKMMDRKALEASMGFRLDSPFFLVTFHPVTLEKDSSKQQIQALLDALDHYGDHKIIFTGANADSGGQVINRLLCLYQKKYPYRYFVVKSLGYVRYLSAMKLCEAVIGNSSSGLLEAPVMKIPAINIGDRQKGRIKPGNVIDCKPRKDSIIEAIDKRKDIVLKMKEGRFLIPFEKNGTSDRVLNVLQQVNLTDILKKSFFDVAPDNTKAFRLF